MKALILAAGIGNRMKPLTNKVHKTLLKIAGKPIINRIIDNLLDEKISDITIVTGYMKDELKSHLKLYYPKQTFSYVNNEKYLTTNNIYSLYLAFKKIEFDDDILLIESDLIFKKEVLRLIKESTNKNIALVSKYHSGMDGTVVSLNNSIIKEVIPPHLQHEDFIFSDKYKTLNIYKFDKFFCETDFKNLLDYYVANTDQNSYYELVLGIIIYMQKVSINAEIVDSQDWAEVDDPNDLSVAEFQFNKKSRLDLLSVNQGGYWNYDIIDYTFIRNMHFPTTSIVSELKNNFTKLIHNYGSSQLKLNEKLSYILNCNKDNIIFLNGSAQVYPILENIFKNKSFLLPNPTFGEYSRFENNSIFYSDSVGVNLEDLENKMLNQDIVVIVNPNNPTGTIISSEWIFSQAVNHKDTIFLVDESFIEFSNEKSIIELIEKNDLENIIVIRSMSKTYGVPGLRVGFVYINNNLIMSEISKNIPIWNINSIAENFIEILIKNKNEVLDSFNKTKVDRDEFVDQLKNVDIIKKVFDSQSNFILIEINKDKLNVDINLSEYLLENHLIYVKDISHKFHKDSCSYLRLAVRTAEENLNLCHILSSL